MKQLTPFPNQDILLIKWKLLFFLICAAISAGIFLAAEYFYNEANRNLSFAQSELFSARSAVELINEEEATIIEYIGRYQQLSDEGIVEPENRLDFLENMAEIRSQFNLFPIALNIEQQGGVRLQYDPSESEPGGPIDLNTSNVSISLSLLHEEDLSRFLEALLNSDGLYQAQECQITLQNRSNTSFLFLAQHLTANCELMWYTFDLPPQV